MDNTNVGSMVKNVSNLKQRARDFNPKYATTIENIESDNITNNKNSYIEHRPALNALNSEFKRLVFQDLKANRQRSNENIKEVQRKNNTKNNSNDNSSTNSIISTTNIVWTNEYENEEQRKVAEILNSNDNNNDDENAEAQASKYDYYNLS